MGSINREDNINNEEMIRKIAESAHAFAEPIDLSPLIEKGLITMKGRSYYVKSLDVLPKEISRRLKECVTTKYGIRVTFYLKGRKGLKKIAHQLRAYL